MQLKAIPKLFVVMMPIGQVRHHIKGPLLNIVIRYSTMISPFTFHEQTKYNNQLTYMLTKSPKRSAIDHICDIDSYDMYSPIEEERKRFDLI